MLKVLDFLFTGFHTLLIFFNLFGWIWPFLRRLNLITLLLTGGSWLILGIFYGLGYCPFTDWHFQILEKLGVNDLPSSYITFLIKRIFNILPNERLVDILTLVSYLIALTCSVIFNIKTFHQKKHLLNDGR